MSRFAQVAVANGPFVLGTRATPSPLARIPDGLSDTEAAPLLCAGITTFNALRHSPARPGDLVTAQGLGGKARFRAVLTMQPAAA